MSFYGKSEYLIGNRLRVGWELRDYFWTLGIKSGFTFTLVYQPDGSSDPQRRHPLSGVYVLYCWLLTEAGEDMCFTLCVYI